MTDDQAYFVRGEDGEEYGPVAPSELREWVGENRVGLGTVVRLEEPDSLWHPWQFYPELVALLAEVQVTGGLPGAAVLAPIGRRILAGIADLIVCSIVSNVAMGICGLFIPANLIASARQITEQMLPGEMPPVVPPAVMEMALFLMGVSFSVQVLYYAGFHAMRGRTPAKALMHIQVVDRAGNKPTFIRALLRGLVYLLSIGLCGIPLFAIFFNPQRRALHDLAAGTYVVES